MPRYIIIKIMKTRERNILESSQRKRVEIIQNVFFDYKGIKLEINNITIIGKAKNNPWSAPPPATVCPNTEGLMHTLSQA